MRNYLIGEGYLYRKALTSRNRPVSNMRTLFAKRLQKVEP
jgi:hypothetical protein